MAQPIHTEANPFASPQPAGHKLSGVLPVRRHGCSASLESSGLLYRRIAVEAPVQVTVEYIGYGLRDRILVDRRLVAWRLPIMGLSGEFDFQIALEASQPFLPGKIIVDVSKYLRIVRFELSIDNQMVYREATGQD